MTYRDIILNMLSNEDIAEMMYASLLPITCDNCPLEKKCNKMMDIYNEELQEKGGNGITCKDVVMTYLDEKTSGRYRIKSNG